MGAHGVISEDWRQVESGAEIVHVNPRSTAAPVDVDPRRARRMPDGVPKQLTQGEAGAVKIAARRRMPGEKAISSLRSSLAAAASAASK